MKGTVSEHLTARRMPTGRIVFSMTEMRAKAEARSLSNIVDWLNQTIRKARATLRTEHSYDQTRDKTSQARGKAVAIDRDIDGLIAAIEAIVAARTVGDPDDPVVKAANTVHRVVYPRGVASITNQSHEIQLGTMLVMEEHFHGDLANEVELLGIQREVARLSRLMKDFRTELSHVNQPGTTYDQVTEARDELHEYMTMAIALVIAAYPSLDPEATRARESLLAPLADQQARVLADRRRRRRVYDVNPDTGEDIIVEGPLADIDDLVEDHEADVLVTEP
ncbi:MAG: hypothetical protein ACNA8W_06810 [Bradymonadaceae bacterium]